MTAAPYRWVKTDSSMALNVRHIVYLYVENGCSKKGRTFWHIQAKLIAGEDITIKTFETEAEALDYLEEIVLHLLK